MWELLKHISHSLSIVRKWLFYILLAITVVLFSVPSQKASADTTNATWKDQTTIIYNSNSYTSPVNDSILKSANLSTKTNSSKAYGYSDSSNKQTDIIYFSSDANVSTATSAQFVTYDESSQKTTTEQTIKLGNTQAAATAGNSSSCNIGGGLSWIICPLSNTIAKGVDTVFNLLKGFLTINPINMNTDKHNAIFTVWNWMRSLANIVFVIVFLVIIYSQLTGGGISNYNVKKLLPRLIVTAVLLNISYIVCATGVDLSNIAGSSVQGIFKTAQSSVLINSSSNWSPSWQSVTSAILAGGTITIAGTYAFVAYNAAGTVFLILPILIGAILALITALIILAARQALIIILIIVSPLAFVAYLLPNTEKLFKKWFDLFNTMLIFYPAFALIFGASQLAGIVIISNSTTLISVILGMAVQVIPLFLTPIIAKLSGSTLGKVAGMLSAQTKKLNGGSKKLFGGIGADKRNAHLAKTPKAGKSFKKLGLTGLGQSIDNVKHHFNYMKQVNESGVEARWQNSKYYKKDKKQMLHSMDYKKLGDDQATQEYLDSKIIRSTDGKTVKLDRLEMDLRNVKLKTENANLELDRAWGANDIPAINAAELNTIKDEKLRKNVLTDRITAGKAKGEGDYDTRRTNEFQKTDEYKHMSKRAQDLLANARDASQMLAINSIRKQSAVRVSQSEAANLFKTDKVARVIAGATEINPGGEQQALAIGVNQNAHLTKEAVLSAHSVINDLNMSINDKVDLLTKNQSFGIISADNKENRLAILEDIGSNDDPRVITNLMQSPAFLKSIQADKDYRETFAAAAHKSGEKLGFINSGSLNKLITGVYDKALRDAVAGNSGALIDQMVADYFNKGGFSVKKYATDSGADLEVISRLADIPNMLTPEAKATALERLDNLLNNPEGEYYGQISDTKDILLEIRNKLKTTSN